MKLNTNTKFILIALIALSLITGYYLWDQSSRAIPKTIVNNKQEQSKNNQSKKLSGNAMDFGNHKEMIMGKNKSDFDLDKEFESINCDNYQIRPYASMQCTVNFKSDLPDTDLGSIMVHWVNDQDKQKTAMLGCLYKNPDNKKILSCDNDIMFIKKGTYIAELSLIEQTKGKILQNNLIVDGEDYPYEITETVNIN